MHEAFIIEKLAVVSGPKGLGSPDGGGEPDGSDDPENLSRAEALSYRAVPARTTAHYRVCRLGIFLSRRHGCGDLEVNLGPS